MPRYILFLAILSIFPSPCVALEPREILVIANRGADQSVRLAQYYMEKREIPKNNLLKVRLTEKEWCARREYDEHVAAVVRGHLQKPEHQGRIKCLVTVYGMPLRVDPPEMSNEENQAHAALKQEWLQLKEAAGQLDKTQADQAKQIKEIETALKENETRRSSLSKKDQRSALDSELAMVMVENYPLAGWQPNPFFIGFKDKSLPYGKEKVLLVARLDGPTPEVVRRAIDDSLAAEKRGLRGSAYFDARWPRPEDKKEVKGYAFYDKSIHLAAQRVKENGIMNVVLEETGTLFQPGACPGAALYCGWYSNGRYVDAFEWKQGAIGYHIASSECTTLKNPKSQVWCKRMLEEGAAVVVGPTSEPYVQAFPLPEVFFGLLVQGRLTVAECYYLATPFLSWQMILVGDPLYRPFVLSASQTDD